MQLVLSVFIRYIVEASVSRECSQQHNWRTMQNVWAYLLYFFPDYPSCLVSLLIGPISHQETFAYTIGTDPNKTKPRNENLNRSERNQIKQNNRKVKEWPSLRAWFRGCQERSGPRRRGARASGGRGRPASWAWTWTGSSSSCCSPPPPRSLVAPPPTTATRASGSPPPVTPRLGCAPEIWRMRNRVLFFLLSLQTDIFFYC